MANENNLFNSINWDSVSSLFTKGLTCLSDLADSSAKFVSAVNSKSTTETDNAVKKQNADTEATKEHNRHLEEMTRIQKEIDSVKNDALSNERKQEKAQQILDMFKIQMNRYLAEETINYQALENLNKVIIELTRILCS